jgi:malate permease and related proteins
MLLEVFAQVMVPILVVVGSGYLLRLTLDLDHRPLSRVSLYLLSPALIFSSLVEAEIAQGQTLRIVAFSVLLVGIMAALTVTAGGMFGFSRETNTALMLSTMFTNTGN